MLWEHVGHFDALRGNYRAANTMHLRKNDPTGWHGTINSAVQSNSANAGCKHSAHKKRSAE